METLILNPSIEYEEVIGLAIYINNIREFKENIIKQKEKLKLE